MQSSMTVICEELHKILETSLQIIQQKQNKYNLIVSTKAEHFKLGIRYLSLR